MSVRVVSILTAIAVGLTAVACAKVPYTHRRQFNLVPDSIMQGLGASTYTSMLQGKQVQVKGTSSEILDRVGSRISSVANKPSYDWQFRLIQEDTINAWCLPGGYIGFYTGILPVLQNEAGMAFVMGHEVGHATARHGSERMSQQMALVGGMGALELYLSGKSKMSPEQQGLIMGALGLGAQFGVMLPFSRAHEKEADVIGLMYMANAGYPPQESVKVWDRMGAASPSNTPMFMSTHPAPGKRQDKLNEWMESAQKRYARNKLAGNMMQTLWEGGPTVPSSGKSTTGGKPTSSGTSTTGGKPTTTTKPTTSGKPTTTDSPKSTPTGKGSGNR
ncbi:MAG: M48 family metallopeptidase [Myxococcota bacterium]